MKRSSVTTSPPSSASPVLARLIAFGIFLASSAGQTAFAAPVLPDTGTIAISLTEAVDLALVYSYAIRQARLDRKDVEEQVRQSWSPVWPRVDGTANYNRNISAANPFAGSSAGGTFDALGAVGWLAFNEQERLEGRTPISLDDYIQRSNDALINAGVSFDPDANPFLVENQVQLGLVIKQVLYDGAVFSGLEASDIAEEIARVGVDVEANTLVRSVASSFYGALLAAQQTGILEKSVARTQSTVTETEQRVQQGVVPQFQLLTAEVELANQQTQLARARNAAKRAIDDLRLVVGLPAGRPVVLRGELTLDGVEVTMPPSADALKVAFERRPDLKRAEMTVRVQEVQESVTWGNFLPKLNAVANLQYIGTIPDDRSFTVSTNNPDDPFEVRTDEEGIFSDAYWFSQVSVGLQLEWNFFEGFATSAQLARDRVATEKSRVQLEQARVTIQTEVEQSLRELKTAQQQIASQDRNRERAELNYQHAQARVREGVSNQFELRQASQQLDESRFNYLQAVHDFLVARVGYLVAIGTPPILGSTSK